MREASGPDPQIGPRLFFGGYRLLRAESQYFSGVGLFRVPSKRKATPMNTLSISYTLPPPGQDYDAVRDVIFAVSTRYAHVDESQFLVQTPFAGAQVELFLSAVIDPNDRYLILGVSANWLNFRPEWFMGAQSAPQTRLQCRRWLNDLRIEGIRRKRLRA